MVPATQNPPPPLTPQTHTHQLINTLQIVQCYVTYWVTGEYQKMPSVTEMLAKLGLETLEVKRSTIRLSR